MIRCHEYISSHEEAVVSLLHLSLIFPADHSTEYIMGDLSA